MVSLAGIARDFQRAGATVARGSADFTHLAQLGAGAKSYGSSIQSGARQIWNAIPGTPVQKGIVIGSVAALAVAAPFTGGADLAAAPEIVGAETGAGVAGFSVIGAGDSLAAGAAAETGVGAEIAGASSPEAAAAASDASTATTSELSTSRAAGPSLARRVVSFLRPTAGIGKYAVAATVGGLGFDYAATFASQGLANFASVLGIQSGGIPYAPPGVAGGGGAAGAPGTSPSTSGTPLWEYLLIGGVVIFALFEFSKRR